MIDQLKTLGQTVTEFTELEVIRVDPNVSEIVFEIEDMTSVCPVTGQPDFESVKILVNPDMFTVETKTLKLYLETYRNQGIFAEHLAAKLANDLQAALGARRVEVTVRQHTRGGIVTKVTAVTRGRSN